MQLVRPRDLLAGGTILSARAWVTFVSRDDCGHVCIPGQSSTCFYELSRFERIDVSEHHLHATAKQRMDEHDAERLLAQFRIRGNLVNAVLLMLCCAVPARTWDIRSAAAPSSGGFSARPKAWIQRTGIHILSCTLGSLSTSYPANLYTRA